MRCSVCGGRNARPSCAKCDREYGERVQLEERARIVSWLRAIANERDNLSDTPRHHALMLATDAIEKGEHLK